MACSVTCITDPRTADPDVPRILSGIRDEVPVLVIS